MCHCGRAAMWPEAFAPWHPLYGIRVAAFIQPVTACSFSPAQMFLALNQTRLASLFVQSHIWDWLKALKKTTEGDAGGAGSTAGVHKSYPNSWPLKRTFCVLVLQSSLLSRLANKVWLSDTSLSSFYQSDRCSGNHSIILHPGLKNKTKQGCSVWEPFPGDSMPHNWVRV